MSHVVDTLMCQVSQMEGPVDAFDLCRLAANLLRTEIDVVASQNIPKKLPAFILELEDKAFCILYRPSLSSLSVQISILHELAHILLGHCPRRPANLFSDYGLYTDAQQREAEVLAHQMMEVIMQKPTNESERIAARFEQVMSKKPEAREVLDTMDQRAALRFRALMAPERRKRRLTRRKSQSGHSSQRD